MIGGYPKFIEEGHNDAWVPLWLQQAGYQTYYVGKLMNYQHILNYNKPFARGFNGSVSTWLSSVPSNQLAS
jgi:hypothetical protein